MFVLIGCALSMSMRRCLSACAAVTVVVVVVAVAGTTFTFDDVSETFGTDVTTAYVEDCVYVGNDDADCFIRSKSRRLSMAESFNGLLNRLFVRVVVLIYDDYIIYNNEILNHVT